jgi:site-specific DNA recombinase
MSAANRAVIYCRMSTAEQVDSPAQQEAACRAKAAAAELEVTEVFVDEGMSGSRLDRPAYHRMLEAAQAKQFDALLLWKQNRLGRDAVETERGMRALEHAGVRLVAIDGYDTAVNSSKNRKLLRGITGLIDQTFIDNLSEDVFRGQSAKVGRKVGYFMGGKPYGYRLVEVTSETELNAYGQPKRLGTTLAVDEEKAEIVRQIFTWYAEGWSPQAIASELNARGVPAPGAAWPNGRHNVSGKWLASTISSDPARGLGILNQSLYVGLYRWGRGRWTKDPETGVPARFDRPEGEWITDTREEWRVVSDDLWQRVRARQAQRSRTVGVAIAAGIAASPARTGGRHSRYWLGSILQCGVCGGNLHGHGAHDYICGGATSGACTNLMRFKRAAIDEAVWTAIKEQLLSPQALADARAALEAELEQQRKDEAAAVRREVNGKDLVRLDKQAAALRALDLSPAALSAALTALDRERSEIVSAATAKVGDKANRAQRVIVGLPGLIEQYRKQIEDGLKVLNDPAHVTAAREAVKRLLVEPAIVLTPSEDGTEMEGHAAFKSLGDLALELAGVRRRLGTKPRAVTVEAEGETLMKSTKRFIGRGRGI